MHKIGSNPPERLFVKNADGSGRRSPIIYCTSIRRSETIITPLSRPPQYETEGGGSVPPKNECRGPQWEFVGLMPGPDRRRFDHYPPPGIDSGAMDHRPPTRTYIFVRRWGSSSGPIAMVEVRLGGGARRRRLLCVVWDGWRWRKKKRGLCLWALF